MSEQIISLIVAILTGLATCILRILDWCAMEGVDVDELLRMKLAYNKGRPYRHGGKAL